MKIFFFVFFLIPIMGLAQEYPQEWFQEVSRDGAPSWEILPQEAKPGEVILSKRTELGVFSNFSATPFELEGKKFASVEGLWQSLKYPDPLLPLDARHAIKEWEYSREVVELMVAYEAKSAGSAANKIYSKYKLKNLSWGEHFFDYKDLASGSEFHYGLIKRAIRAKLNQNPGLWDLLIRTGCLKLKPDHVPGENDPPAYKYYLILMELRTERQFVPCL